MALELSLELRHVTMIKKVIPLAVTILSIGEPSVQGAEIVPQGILAKSSAGAGQTTVTGPMALFYNPANIGISSELQADFDIGQVDYRYEYTHTNQEKFNPVVIASKAPPVSLGTSMKVNSAWTLALSLFPTGIGSKQIVIDIPLYLGTGIYQIVDVELINSGSKIVLGSSYRPAPWILLGLSIMRIEEKSDTSVFIAGELFPFLRTISEGVFYRPTIGVRTLTPLSNLTVGLSISPTVVKKYTGKFLFDFDREDQKKGIFNYQPTQQMDVIPLTVGTGLHWKSPSWSLFIDAVYEAWKQGQDRVTRGLPIASPKQDLKNIVNTTIGGSIKIAHNELKAAYGHQPANLGDGLRYVKPTGNTLDVPSPISSDKEAESSSSLAAQQDAEAPALEGMTFGNISGIDRKVFALGWQRSFGFLSSDTAKAPGYVSVTLYSMAGNRTVPPGFSQEGQYKFKLNMVTIGGAYRL